MKPSISHDRNEETLEAKARWFQSLSVEERLDLFCEINELALTVHPELAEKRHASAPKGRVQVLRLP